MSENYECTVFARIAWPGHLEPMADFGHVNGRRFGA
ncbi:hypothetical protein FHT44_004428 [Mycolicibacterium sp. BK634]|nr:hypothetical protein [Mycolicibacterium sp. BK634]